MPAPLAAQDPTRKILLDDLFEACDDDGSGALSLDEFSKLFDKKLDSQADIRAGLKMADVQQVDGKLSKDEFVTYHLQKFAATEDSVFEMMIKVACRLNSISHTRFLPSRFSPSAQLLYTRCAVLRLA